MSIVDIPVVRRAVALVTLALVALVPFALVCCKGAAPPSETAVNLLAPADAAAPPVADEKPTAIVAAKETPTAPVTTSPPTPTPTPTPPPAVAPPAPPLAAYKGPIPKTCAELDRALNAAASERACASDADCATAARDCGCSGALARRALPKFEALRDAYRAKDCANKGPPRPCASCPPPPAVVCEAKLCTPHS